MAMITTVQQHILQQQQAALKSTGREASGTFSWLLSGITLAAKMVEARIRSAGPERCVRSIWSRECAGRATAEARRLREPGVAALPWTTGQCRGSGERRRRRACDLQPGCGDGQVNHRLRPAGRLEQHRCECQCGDDLQRATSFARRARDIGGVRFCSRDSARWPRGYVVYGPSTVLVYTTGSGVSRIYAGPDDRRVRAEQRADADARAGQLLQCE